MRLPFGLNRGLILIGSFSHGGGDANECLPTSFRSLRSPPTVPVLQARFTPMISDCSRFWAFSKTSNRANSEQPRRRESQHSPWTAELLNVCTWLGITSRQCPTTRKNSEYTYLQSKSFRANLQALTFHGSILSLTPSTLLLLRKNPRTIASCGSEILQIRP
jgi:hypothetical protein